MLYLKCPEFPDTRFLSLSLSVKNMFTRNFKILIILMIKLEHHYWILYLNCSIHFCMKSCQSLQTKNDNTKIHEMISLCINPFISYSSSLILNIYLSSYIKIGTNKLYHLMICDALNIMFNHWQVRGANVPLYIDDSGCKKSRSHVVAKPAVSPNLASKSAERNLVSDLFQGNC